MADRPAKTDAMASDNEGLAGASAPGAAASPSKGRTLLAGTMQVAMLWNLLSFVVSQASGFVVFLVLATKLPPEVFGMVAIASVVSDFLAIDGRAACMDAIMQMRRFENRILNSAFAGFFAVTLVIGAGIALASPLIAGLFGDPGLQPFLVAFAVLLLPIPWLAVMDALMMRDLQFRKVTERNMVGSLAAGLAGIAWTFTPWAIWALVVQRLVHVVVTGALEYRLTRWLPGGQVDIREAGAFLHRLFSLWLILAITQIVGRAITFVFGLRYDTATVGLTRSATKIVETVQLPLVSPLMGLWFPLMSKVHGNLASERAIYDNILRTSAFLCFPAFAGLALVSHDVVELLLPAAYQGTAPLIAAMALTRLLIPLTWFNTIAMTSLGMNRTSLAYTAVTVAVEVGALLLISWVNAATALLLMPLPTVLVGVWGALVLNNRLQQTHRSHYAELLPPAIAAAVLAAMVWLVQTWMAGQWPLPRLLASVAVGAVSYAGWLWLFHREWTLSRIDLLRGRVDGQPAN